MMSREEWNSLLTLAAHAPSGDNAQPWKFIVRGASVEIYNIPGKDSSPYNFKERGSFFAHGAVIENIIILLAAAGYDGKIELFPAIKTNCVAVLTIGEKQTLSDAKKLAAEIPLRRTNRKPYKKKPLLQDHKEALIETFKQFGFGTFHLVEDQKTISNVAKTLSLSDQLIFEDKNIHDAIFNSIRWTKEDEEKRKGLYIKTLELPPPAQVLFKMFTSWPVLQWGNKINIAKFISAQSAKGYSASSAFGIISMPSDDTESFVAAGRLFQRLWLIASQCGVDIQPVTALAYLAQRIQARAALDLSENHQEKILAAEKNIRMLFNVDSGTIAMIFRMGYGNQPTAQSQKSIPEIVYA